MTEGVLFSDSPFTLTATPRAAKFWCARPEGLKRVSRIIAGIRADANSALDLIWANFGSGKSHVLYFISNELQKRTTHPVVSYVELSEQARSFMDLYRSIVGGLDLNLLFANVDPTKVVGIDSNLTKMVSLYKFGSQEERELASRWIRAEKIDLRELRRLSNVTARVEDERHALDVLRGLIGLSVSSNMPVVLLIDEFQRMAVVSERPRAAIMSAIRTLFNQNPNGLTIVVAVTSGIEQTAMALLPPELKTIMGPRPTVSLPEMSKDEALNFCRERLTAYRPAGYSGDSFAPFTDGAIKTMVDIVSDEANVRLTPRNIIHALAWLYEDFVVNERTSYSTSEAKIAMHELSWGGMQ